MAQPVIAVEELEKSYGSVRAVDGISFEVDAGEIFGIVGPNGAGKTTTIECLEDLRTPDAGQLRVLGLDPRRDGPALRERIGAQLQESALPARLRVGEAAHLFASPRAVTAGSRRSGGSHVPAARVALIAVVLLALAGCATQTPSAAPGTPSASPVSAATVLPSPTATPTPSATSAPQAGIDGLVALVEDLGSRGELSGGVLIGRGREIAWESAYGLADRDPELPNRTSTKFNLGSMNKMFTAVAILQLVERGELALDDTIADALPDYPNEAVADVVTIHQLLTHTSGLGDVFTTQFEADPHRYRSNADFLPLFVDEPLLFDPGTSWSYSNAGYVVLGLVIERLSGDSYDAYVRKHIFEPSGMPDTAAHDVDEAVPDLAVGYTTHDVSGNETGVLAANTPTLPGRGFAAGGGYSTTGDLFRFRNALLSNELLSPASTELLLAGKSDMAAHVRYAYGFMDRVDAGQRVVGHTGGAPGVCSFLSMYLDTGYTAVVLSNSDSGCVPVLEYLREHPLE